MQPFHAGRRAPLLLALAISAGLAACDAGRRGGPPDENPVMKNAEPPFHYPASLYALEVQGNVMLRLFVDETGVVLPESTRVQESSSYAEFDSAAVAGSESLRFVPAKRDGEPIAVSILFPVFFRHPAAKPLSGDTVLQQQQQQRQAGRAPPP